MLILLINLFDFCNASYSFIIMYVRHTTFLHVHDFIITTRCSMREIRETALLHAWVQSPIRPHDHRQLHQFIACIFIYSTKWP